MKLLTGAAIATTAPIPRAWRGGEAARSSRSDAGRPRAAIASAGNRSAMNGWRYRRRMSGWRRRHAAPMRSASASAARPDLLPDAVASRTTSAISAASRNPMLRPCAPIGGSTWAASPTSAMRCLRKLSGLFDRKRKQMPSRLDADPAENGMRLRFGGLRQFIVAQRDQPFGLLWRRDPHHAAAVAGQRHEHARPLRRMKLRGDISMRPEWLMLKVSAA